MRQLGAQFALSMKIKKEANLMFTITKQKGESLENFTQDLIRENIGIVNYNESIAVKAFRKGLVRENPLYDSLTQKAPKTMTEAISQASKYINLERNKKHTRNEKHRD